MICNVCGAVRGGETRMGEHQPKGRVGHAQHSLPKGTTADGARGKREQSLSLAARRHERGRLPRALGVEKNRMLAQEFGELADEA